MRCSAHLAQATQTFAHLEQAMDWLQLAGHDTSSQPRQHMLANGKKHLESPTPFDLSCCCLRLTAGANHACANPYRRLHYCCCQLVRHREPAHTGCLPRTEGEAIRLPHPVQNSPTLFASPQTRIDALSWMHQDLCLWSFLLVE